MVFVGGRQEEEEREDSKTSEARFIMAMPPERSRSLHNFSFPRGNWGSRRLLRCVKGGDDGVAEGGTYSRHLDRRSQTSTSKDCSDSGGPPPRKSPESERKKRSFFGPEDYGRSSSRFQPSTAEVGRRSSVDCDGDDGLEAARKKVMLDLQTKIDKMKFSVLSDRSEEIAPPFHPPRTEAPPVAEAKPWNLRNRRAACKEPNRNGSARNQWFDEGIYSLSPVKGAMKSPARINDVGGNEYGVDKGPRAKFSVSLSNQEIDEDFIAIMGIRPPRRPKKRPRCVQKQLDTLFPGLWLSEITSDMYKVNDTPENGKK